MILFFIAFLLYFIGFIGVLLDNPGEFWLWFLAFGLMLDLMLILLACLDSPRLIFAKRSSTAAKAMHTLALLLAGLAAYLRLRAEISWFLLVSGIILILWTYSIFELNKTWRRNKNE